MANPTLYQTLHLPLESAPTISGSCIIVSDNVSGDIKRFRVFIPPGATDVTLSILNSGGGSARARHKNPPSVEDLSGATDISYRDLLSLESADQLIAENPDGIITIMSGLDAMVTDYTAGWLYVYNSGGANNVVQFTLTVNAEVYNAWKAPISWARQAEGMQQFGTAPPTDCVSLTGFYPRASDSITAVNLFNYSSTDNSELEYVPYFRIFVPPGTNNMMVLIINTVAAGNMAVMRYKVPMTGLPEDPPDDYVLKYSYYSLSELEVADGWVSTSSSVPSALNVAFYPHDGEDIVGTFDAGWLYVKSNVGEHVGDCYIIASLNVYTQPFNAWWDTYIKDEDGWNTYVQNVATYIPPTGTEDTGKGIIASPTSLDFGFVSI